MITAVPARRDLDPLSRPRETDNIGNRRVRAIAGTHRQPESDLGSTDLCFRGKVDIPRSSSGGGGLRLVFNSDALFHRGLVRDSLGGATGQLLSQCGRSGVPVVLPETTLLEYECKQNLLAEKKRNDLRVASSELRAFGVEVPEFNADEVAPVLQLEQLIRDCGATVEVAKATLENYEDAHRRACLHLEPDKPASESGKRDPDEMRDLVIWSVALSIARRNGGAILISRDTVHAKGGTTSEAHDAGLVVLDSAEAAISWLDDQSFPYLRRLAERCLALLAEADAANFDTGRRVQTIEIDEVELEPAGGDALIAFSFTTSGGGEPSSIDVQALLTDSTTARVEVSARRGTSSLSLDAEEIPGLTPFSPSHLLTTFGD